ncbi:ABC transporter ATP-binding protein [Ferruginibacter albus]|uniref:ABC transporter ATP-binding protein n=1 Tax=Ferruginibacter albus TaxID=2875540 RepID=UPI001CC6AA60|nr:ABC transporter ATP-binding protein [Ferruginibacter albus]UAY51718.1 ABC transporter ATP-binding protein [Ferruginibacter albus]
MNQPLLQIQDLSVGFTTDNKSVAAVKSSSFEINAGEITVIVGESGSGKSITSLAIMQLLPKQANTSGKILFNKENAPTVDLLSLSEKEINAVRGKDIAMIFQEPMTSLNPVLTCGWQVMETILLHKKLSQSEAKKRTIELFEKVKLPEPAIIFDRYPHQLSGGQKQRVMIAMAMSCDPALLIADEPTTALDVTVQRTIIDLLKELQQQTKMSIIFITHDLALAAEIGSTILVMYKGEIVEQGNAKQILQEPKHAYTKKLLGSKLKGKGYTAAGISLSPVLKIENLQVCFLKKKKLFGADRYVKVVDDVSFEVYKGETIGLVGESGCGKTTLGRTILQLIKQTAGKVILNGTNLTALTKQQLQPLRKNIQIVFQDPYGSLNPRIKIGDAIAEPMKVHGMLNSDIQRKEKVITLLNKVNLDASVYDKYPHQFSGGQRQRICIARALALSPSFLIFDESVSALDVTIQAQVLALLNELKKEFAFTSIFISHDLSIVHYISDRILVMQKGKIIEQGTADDVYFSPQHPYTKKLLASMPKGIGV